MHMLLTATQQATPSIDPVYVWLAGVGMFLAGLFVAFAYVLLRRHRNWLGEQFDRLDAYLSAHAPGLWRRLRTRFSREAWYGLTLTFSLVFCIGLIFLFASITEGWTNQEALYRIDRSVNNALDGLLAPGAVRAISLFTDLGSLPFASAVSVVLALLFAFRKRWWRLASFAMVMGGGEAVLWTLKWVFARDRPATRLMTPAGASYPSGHAFTAMVLYGFLIFMVWRWTHNIHLRLALTTLLWLVIVMIGLSRIMLSVHWVSDVVGGFTIGLAWLVFSLIFTRALQAYRARTAA